MAIKLIAVDIDGTLLNSEKELTPATVAAFQAAADRGIHMVIATGRPLSEFRFLAAQLPMMQYVVTCTGAQVIDLRTEADIFRAAFTADEMREIYGRICDLDLLLQIFDEHDGMIHNDARRLARAEDYCGPALAKLLVGTHVAEDDLDAYVAAYRGMTNKFHAFIGDPAIKAEAIRRLQSLPLALTESADNDLEIMPLGVEKGIGLSKLAAYLGLDRTELMTMGDGGNDVEMLQYAGLGAAMQNASDAAKAAADWVLPWTNDQDGVAKAIRHILDGGEAP